MAVQYYEGIGRRKESTARVRLMNGSGRFIVNDKEALTYFPRVGDMEAIIGPMKAAGQELATYDITVVVNGGGVSGQTDSVKLGLARALTKMNPDFGVAMRKGGFLTRDPRVKERKKPGLKRARKAPPTPSAKRTPRTDFQSDRSEPGFPGDAGPECYSNFRDATCPGRPGRSESQARLHGYSPGQITRVGCALC